MVGLGLGELVGLEHPYILVEPLFSAVPPQFFYLRHHLIQNLLVVDNAQRRATVTGIMEEGINLSLSLCHGQKGVEFSQHILFLLIQITIHLHEEVQTEIIAREVAVHAVKVVNEKAYFGDDPVVRQRDERPLPDHPLHG